MEVIMKENGLIALEMDSEYMCINKIISSIGLMEPIKKVIGKMIKQKEREN